VILQFRGLGRDEHLLTIKEQHVTKHYTGPLTWRDPGNGEWTWDLEHGMSGVSIEHIHWKQKQVN
jgi:hypothetical protein